MSEPSSPPLLQPNVAPAGLSAGHEPKVPVPAAVLPLENWFRQRRHAVLVLLLLLAVLFRITYFIQFLECPCIAQTAWQESDMNFHHQSATRIVSEGWLYPHVYVPYHSWMLETGRAFFRMYPERIPEFTEPGKEPGEVMWERLVGGSRYCQEPLYVYWVAVLYKIFGTNLRAVIAAQMLAGVFSVALLILLTRLYFGHLAGALAGTLAVCCAPLMYYEAFLLRESLMVFAGLFFLLVASHAWEHGTFKLWLASGAVFALAWMLKQTFMPMGPGLLLFWALSQRRSRPRLRNGLGGFVLGALLLLLPLMMRNQSMGLPALAQPRGGELALLFANSSYVQPDGLLVVNSEHAAQYLAAGKISNFSALAAAFQTHPDVWSILGLYVKKFCTAWRWLEIPNNENIEYLKLDAPILRGLPFAFWSIAPWGLLGLGLGLRYWRACWPLVLFALLVFLPMLVSQPLGRYRLGLLSILLPFAALGLLHLFAWLRSGAWRRAVPALLGVAALMYWSGKAEPQDRQVARLADFQFAYYFYYIPIYQDAHARKNWDYAEGKLRQFLRHEPALLETQASAAQNSELALIFAKAHAQYSNLLKQCGRAQDAVAHEKRARELFAVGLPTQAPETPGP